VALFKKSEDDLIGQLSSRNPEKRSEAVKKLGEYKTPSGSKAIANILRSETNGQVIIDAIIALLATKDAAAMQLGIEALDFLASNTKRDSYGFDQQFLSCLVYAMGFSGSPIFFDYAVSLSSHLSSDVRWKARIGLSNIGLPGAYRVLINDFNNEKDQIVRSWTLQAIRQLLHPDAFYLFSSLVFSPNSSEQDEAQNGLKWIASALGLELYLPCYEPNRLREIIDTLDRALRTNFEGYVKSRAMSWLSKREFYRSYIRCQRSIEVITRGLLANNDQYSQKWTAFVIESLSK